MAEKGKHSHGFTFDDETEAALDWLRKQTDISAVKLVKKALLEYARARGYDATVESAITERNPDALAVAKERDFIGELPQRAPSRPAPKSGAATPKGSMRR